MPRKPTIVRPAKYNTVYMTSMASSLLEELYYKPTSAHTDPLYILINIKVRESGEYSCDDFALTTISHYWDAATVKLMKKYKVPFRMKRVPV